jgi:hypothetical protein
MGAHFTARDVVVTAATPDVVERLVRYVTDVDPCIRGPGAE